jgi:hypothetical protein
MKELKFEEFNSIFYEDFNIELVTSVNQLRLKYRYY